jgi:hypothetical protein
MARIRTIKPDFWTSEQVMDCKPLTRLLFIGLWNFVDDYGRSPVAPRTIRARIFPGDDISGADVQDMLNELNSRGLILFYSADDKEYFEITGWAKHQKIDNPSKNNLCPAPFAEGSQILARTSEESPKIALEGKGEDRKGKEKIIRAASPSNEDFEEFKKVYPKRAGNYGWKAAERKYLALVKTGVSPQAINTAAKRHAEEMRKLKRLGTEFVPMPASWLNAEDFVFVAVNSFNDEPKQIDWDNIVSFYKRTKVWTRDVGPDPESPACQAPEEILRKHGIQPTGASHG